MSGLTGVCYLPLIPSQPVNALGGGQAMPNIPAVPRVARRDGAIDAEFIQNSCAITRTVKQVLPTDPITKAWLTVKAALADADGAAKLQKIITTATAQANPGKVTQDGSPSQGNGTATLVFGIVIADTATLPANTALFYDIQVLTQSGALYTVEAGGGIGGAGGGFNLAPRVTGAVS